jgi:hypothetical protein
LICYINRGLPGSGKSTLGRKTAAFHLALGEAVYIFASDDYFVQNAAGEYRWEAYLLLQAHLWNYRRFTAAADAHADVLIVDNVNVSIREAKPFVVYAHSKGYEIIFLEPKTPWAFDVKELAVRNSHGVPLQALERMKRRYVPDMTLEMVLQHQCRNKLADYDAHEDEKAIVAMESL